MIIRVDTTGSAQSFGATLDEVANHAEVRGVLILACDENGLAPEDVDDYLRAAPVPVFGGVFPQIIHGREKLAQGTIVAGLTRNVDVYEIENLSDGAADFDEVIDALIPEIGDAKTMFVLVDGYSKRISDLIESLFNIFGLELNYIGGGAGSINPTKLDMTQTSCIFTNQGLKKDCAILAMMEAPSGIGVRHGFDKKLSGPHKITESEGNTIKSLDWKPAFQVYREVVEKHSGTTITEANFFDMAKGYPFGITKLESERIVRDPFTVDKDDCLIVASDIPPESFVDILTGDVESLVDAARASYSEAIKAYDGGTSRSILFMDCISRVLYLGDDFVKEMEAVCVDDTPLIGALSLGEIANSGSDYLELYNKTCVVGMLGD